MYREKWHLEKTISLTNIGGLIMAMLMGFGAYDSLTDRLAIQETNMNNLNQRVLSLIERQVNTDKVQDDGLREFRAEMRTDIRSIQGKLDRIIENYIE